MAELWSDFTEKLGSLAGKWTAYAAFGSFLLYLLGYLTLRFQLSTYGVATDLDLFDEKYLFAGCRFLVNLVSAVPNVLILIFVLAAIGYLPYKLMPTSGQKFRLKRWVSTWCAVPLHLPLLGAVLAVVFIQLVMRKCFAFGNLLLSKQPPDEWITSVLLTSNGKLSLYFSGLVAGTLLTGGILLWVLRRGTATTAASRFWLRVLIFLFAVEFLLLPVNYGVLISTQQLPRVAELSGEATPPGQLGWLLWDSKDAVTYFVRDANDRRMIVTLPRKDARLRIVAYDDIFCVLFGNHVESRPCPR